MCFQHTSAVFPSSHSVLMYFPVLPPHLWVNRQFGCHFTKVASLPITCCSSWHVDLNHRVLSQSWSTGFRQVCSWTHKQNSHARSCFNHFPTQRNKNTRDIKSNTLIVISCDIRVCWWFCWQLKYEMYLCNCINVAYHFKWNPGAVSLTHSWWYIKVSSVTLVQWQHCVQFGWGTAETAVLLMERDMH